MAKLSRKEFAELCRTKPTIVTMNIRRGKIVELNKKIDTENPLNKDFFNRYIAKAKKEEEELRQQLYKKVVHKIDTPIVKKKPKRKSSKRTIANAAKKFADDLSEDLDDETKKEYDRAEEVLSWETRKKKAEALLKERQAEKELLSVKKLYGEMLPTDFTRQMFMSYTKTVLSVFQNSLANLAGVFCDELAGGDREALTRINQKLDEELQLVVNEAKDVALKDMQNVIKEFSITRNKGQKH